MPHTLFSIENWSAWAPGTEGEPAWRQWALGNPQNNGAPEPNVAFLPAMLRRRLSRLSKMALKVAFECAGSYKDVCSVFCSKHGEIVRTQELLNSLAINEDLSPTAFSLSVHNTASGLYSIARQDTAATKAIAAGNDTFIAGFADALATLTLKPIERILLVYVNDELPLRYAAFKEKNDAPFAAAFLLTHPGRNGGEIFDFELGAVAKDVPETVLSQAENFLKFLLSGNDSLLVPGINTQYRWSRHARVS